MFRRFAPLAVLLALPGCLWADQEMLYPVNEPPALGPALVNLEVLSVINTKKTLGDHLATWVTGKDCSTIRAQREGAWCVDWPAPPAPPPQVYCYASLARPSCYAQPYNEGNDRLIGFVPASTPIRR
jgi:hypothetical protein